MASILDTLYELPEELIATDPPAIQGTSRLLMVRRSDGGLTDGRFADIRSLLRPGDCLVMNNTRVFKARLFARTDNGRNIEMLLTERLDPSSFLAFVKNSKKFEPGTQIQFGHRQAIIGVRQDDTRVIRFLEPIEFSEINALGEVPLPPYIIKKRQKEGHARVTGADDLRYQSVMAKLDGSVAAPTASLHFTDSFLDELKESGVNVAEVTLHVGPGTFKPIDTDSLDDFAMHREWGEVSNETISVLQKTRRNGGRIIAIGTTVVRTLETMAAGQPNPELWKPFSGHTGIFIRPPYQFMAVEGLVTNFHMPRSTLLLLVQAFGGPDNLKAAYQHAILEKYRFLSYGDAMVII